MAQSSQSTPTVSANIGGATHQVNLRDYLNIRVAPFLKKAITESLDASPEFPLQWLGENLIHQSMLYEANPDRTNIQERFLYKFETPVAAPSTTTMSAEPSIQLEPSTMAAEPSVDLAPTANGSAVLDAPAAQDTQMANHLTTENEPAQDQQGDELRDTEMAGTS